jgi:starch-binding outer membrane protein SusE/F
MKKIYNFINVFLLLVLVSSCTDKDLISVATPPTEDAFLLTPSTMTLELNKVGAGKHTAIVFNWDTIVYGISTPVEFTLQMDSVKGDFSSPIVDIIPTNTYEISFTDSVVNARALKLNLLPDVPGEIKVRLKANLAYNSLPVYTKVVTITVTPYENSLMYRMPATLYLQGDALASNGSFAIPESQHLAKVDNHRFALLVSLIGGKHFVFTSSGAAMSDPVYKAATSTEPITGGNFIPSGSQTTPPNGGSDISSPTLSGIYTVIVDFATGTYSVTKAPGLIATPASLYMVGDATALGWAAPNSTQKFTLIDDYTFEITLPLKAGKKYDFITTETTWSDPAYKGATSAEPVMGGSFIESGKNTVPAWAGSDIFSPSASGTYKITVCFKSGTFVLTQ